MFQRSVGVLALCAGLAIGVCGCNSARLVRWDGATGVVAIPTNDDSWPTHNREHAEALMKQQCPRGYQIVSEEEVVVGQVQHTHTNVDRTGDPTLAALHIAPVSTKTNETTTVEDKKEWRITFHSVDAPPTVAPPGVVQTGAFVPAAAPRPTPPGLPSSPVPIAQ
jgi:hypothetical protein